MGEREGGREREGGGERESEFMNGVANPGIR